MQYAAIGAHSQYSQYPWRQKAVDPFTRNHVEALNNAAVTSAPSKPPGRRGHFHDDPALGVRLSLGGALEQSQQRPCNRM